MGLMETPASLQETQAGSVRPPVVGLAGLVVEPVGQGRWDHDAGITTLGSIQRLRLRERPRSVQDRRTRAVHPGDVVPPV